MSVFEIESAPPLDISPPPQNSRRSRRPNPSARSRNFSRAREEIASDLRARGLEVKVQRDFRQEAGTETTLQKLDLYIRGCDALAHIAGRRSGAFPGEAEPLFRRALAILEASLGPDHPNSATVRGNLAALEAALR